MIFYIILGYTCNIGAYSSLGAVSLVAFLYFEYWAWQGILGLGRSYLCSHFLCDLGFTSLRCGKCSSIGTFTTVVSFFPFNVNNLILLYGVNAILPFFFSPLFSIKTVHHKGNFDVSEGVLTQSQCVWILIISVWRQAFTETVFDIISECGNPYMSVFIF